MNTTLLLVVTGAAAFAAGWFLKPSGAARVTLPPGTVSARAATPVAREDNPFREAMAPAAARGSDAIEPFRSVEEVLSLVRHMLDGGIDELSDFGALEIMEALPRLMVTDVAAVRSMLEQMAASARGNPDVRTMAAAMLAVRWILQEPEAATGYVFANRALFSEAHQAGSLAVLFDAGDVLGWVGIAMTARRNPGAAKAMLSQLPDGGGDDLKEIVTMMEGKADPGRFLTTASKETLGEIDDVTPLLARWARQDPQAALRWTQTQEDPDDDAWVAIARGWADRDRAAATAWASSLTDEAHRRATLTAIASKAVAGLDAAAAEVMLAAFPPEVAARARLQHLSSTNHASAADSAMVQDILFQFADDREIMEAAAMPAASIVHGFWRAENGETTALGWLTPLPEGPARSRAAAALIDHWAEDDPAAASAWIRALPAGDTRESATVQLIREISGNDPASALEWARSISTEGTRRAQARSILTGWLLQDPHKAMEALQQFPLEEQAAMFSR